MRSCHLSACCYSSCAFSYLYCQCCNLFLELLYNSRIVRLTHFIERGNVVDDGSGVNSNDIYRGRVESVLVSLLSYASLPIWKLHPHSNIISKSYKSTFHNGHLSHNMSYGSVATLWVFYLLQWRYSYST